MSQTIDKPTLPGIQFLLNSDDGGEEKKIATSQEEEEGRGKRENGTGSMNTRPIGHRSTRSVSSLPSDLQKLSLYPTTTQDDSSVMKQRQDTMMMESAAASINTVTTTSTTSSPQQQYQQGQQQGQHLPFTMSSTQNSSNSKAPSWMHQPSGPVLLPPLPHQVGSSNNTSNTTSPRPFHHHQHHRRPAGVNHGRSISEYTIQPQSHHHLHLQHHNHYQPHHHLQPPLPHHHQHSNSLQTSIQQSHHQRALLPIDSLHYLNRPSTLSSSSSSSSSRLTGRPQHHTHRRAVSANTVDFMFRPPVPSSSSSSTTSSSSSNTNHHHQQQHQRAQSDSPPEQRLRSPPLPPISSTSSTTSTSVSQQDIDGDQQQPQLQRDANSGRYLCPYCNKGFSRPSSLRIHTYSHTGEKPFVCAEEGCGRRFSVQSNMRRHLRVHRLGRSSVKTGSPLRKL